MRDKALLLLDRLDLVCPLLASAALAGRPPDVFLVPCVPLYDFGDDGGEEGWTTATATATAALPPLLAVLDFQGFLPDTLLPRMLLEGVREGQWAPPKLGYVPTTPLPNVRTLLVISVRRLVRCTRPLL